MIQLTTDTTTYMRSEKQPARALLEIAGICMVLAIAHIANEAIKAIGSPKGGTP